MSKKILDSAIELELYADEYFDDCLVNNKPFTMPGLSYALGFSSTSTLLTYRKGENHKEFHEAANRACLRVEAFTAEKLYDKGVNVAGPVFALKNQGWSDKKEGEGNTMVVKIVGAAARL